MLLATRPRGPGPPPGTAVPDGDGWVAPHCAPSAVQIAMAIHRGTSGDYQLGTLEGLRTLPRRGRPGKARPSPRDQQSFPNVRRWVGRETEACPTGSDCDVDMRIAPGRSKP